MIVTLTGKVPSRSQELVLKNGKPFAGAMVLLMPENQKDWGLHYGRIERFGRNISAGRDCAGEICADRAPRMDGTSSGPSRVLEPFCRRGFGGKAGISRGVGSTITSRR